jgi:hypothetical protein
MCGALRPRHLCAIIMLLKAQGELRICLGDCIIILDLKLETNSSSGILGSHCAEYYHPRGCETVSLVDSVNVQQKPAASILTVEK